MTKICKKCGSDEFTDATHCGPCARARAKKWVDENRERAKETKRLYYLANKEKIAAQTRAKRQANLEKSREYEKRRKRDPEKVRQYKAKYRAANRAKIRESEKRRLAREPEKVRVEKARWREKNPEQCRIHVQNRNARKKYNGGKLSRGLAQKLLELQKGRCACCRCDITKKYHLDHIMPLALGGAHEDSNIQLLCQPCNQSKSAKHPVDFMRSKGLLC